ncbi:hypothetical protein COLO4_03465 [Corchorus olitorius]|uniref:Uncharacterized protein n=1 Tax=Corchorus olitorius TaxID=93759 RepID=A0A1R3KYJ7_9ROSI|nr:hypothetical protein COLO4_03465 [Corchorus olitorius]
MSSSNFHEAEESSSGVSVPMPSGSSLGSKERWVRVIMIKVMKFGKFMRVEGRVVMTMVAVRAMVKLPVRL